MRVLRIVALLALLVALLVWGVRYDEPEQRRAYMAGDELTWVRAFESWLFDIRDIADETRTDASSTTYPRLEDCASFERGIADAPSERLARIRVMTATACDELASFSRLWPTDAGPAEAHWRRGNDLLIDADDAIHELFGYTSALPTTTGHDARIEARFSKIATEWAGFDVEVRCFPGSDWSRALAEYDAWYGDESDEEVVGFADTDWDLIALGPEVCEPLLDVRRGSSLPASGTDVRADLAFAVVGLAHEITHIDDPGASEAEAECAAMQRAPWTAVRLGFRRIDGWRLANEYWRESYPEADEEYRSDECHDGGALDEHESTSRWP